MPHKQISGRIQKCPASKPLKRGRRLPQCKVIETSKDLDYCPPETKHLTPALKRKHTPEPDTSEQTIKRSRRESDPEEQLYGDEVNWKDYFGTWPVSLSESNQNMAEPRTAKRSRTPSQISWSQSQREGDVPHAYTHQHEELMKEAGLVMVIRDTQPSVTADCDKLCEQLLNAKYPTPNTPSFQPERFAKVLERIRLCNEARVVRDVTPMIVPSAELLYVDGYDVDFSISEAMHAEWTRCDTICGPRPKPDFAAGVGRSAFDADQRNMLKLGQTSASPNLFPENIYFPFLVCEVKSSDRSIEEAERQAMHSASIATRAVIQLFRQASAEHEVDCKLLVFSIAHNHSTARVYGHYAKIETDKLTFYRKLLHSCEFATKLASEEWTQTWQITRAIYEHFYPMHLKRIKGALARIRAPAIEADVQDPAADPSPEDGQFKKPSLPSTARLEQENERLRDQFMKMVQDQQSESIRHREEAREQRALFERQLADQRDQRAQMERQLADQKEQMERQLAQHQEIVSLLKESRSR